MANIHPYIMVCTNCWTKAKCDCGDEYRQPIDEVIVDTIINLNHKGYVTLYSCQGSEGAIGSTYVAIHSSSLTLALVAFLVHKTLTGEFELTKLQGNLYGIYAHDECLEKQQQKFIELMQELP